MKFDVMLRTGSSGGFMKAVALTLGDSLDTLRAEIEQEGKGVLPNNGLIVVVRSSVPAQHVWELLKAGFAVQIRDVLYPRPSPPADVDVELDPEDIDLA